MAIPKRTVRGVHDLRTYSGKVDIFQEPHRAYMQISCLEMEKVRRSKERDSAMQRVRQIDARFREIEKEEAYLLKGLDGIKLIRHSTGRLFDASGLHATRSFRIKY
ncbi:MAG TPA: hypothetical protein VM163_08995 [bacterium]|nr:hypothetical protein [bacterium]